MNSADRGFRQGPWPVIMATLLCLLPFLNKAFHIDDTMFLWAARQIQTQPFDFYGFSVNWYSTMLPMAEVMQNPPLVSYYIGLVAFLFGWQEWVLHAAFLAPAVGVVLGTFILAKKFTSHPRIAALIALGTPVFLVSATSVMSDVMMVSFYLWAVILWIRGLDSNRFSWPFAAGLLAALAALTKYFGLSSIFLLLVYTIARSKKFDRRLAVLLFLVLPICIILGYEAVTEALYDRRKFSETFSYAMTFPGKDGLHLFDRALTGLAFTGGGVASALFFAPLLWPRRIWLAGGLVSFVTILAIVLLKGSLGELALIADGSVRWMPVLQVVLAVAGGLHLLTLAGADLYFRRDAAGVMLFCWVAGTFVFAAFLNWTISGRVILPMVPAAAILAARRLDARSATVRQPKAAVIPLAFSLLLSLAVAWEDSALANTQRLAAATISRDLEGEDATVWFQGHWGFQHYMEKSGAQAVDFSSSIAEPGDFLVVPGNNANLNYDISRSFRLIRTYRFTANTAIGIMRKPPVGAGFYTSLWGPLPFVFGRIPPEEYWLLQME